MQTTIVQPASISSAPATLANGWSDFAIGLALTSLVPALFWTAAFALVANLIGYDPAPASLFMVAAAVATFLGAFFTILTAKQR